MRKLALVTSAAGVLLVGGAAAAHAQWSLGNGFRGATAETSDAYVSGPRAEAVPSCAVTSERERHRGRTVLRKAPHC